MTPKKIIKIANEIKDSYEFKVIKDIEFPTLVNGRLEDIGMGVIFQLSTKFNFEEATIYEWKEKLSAKDWYISAKRNQLRLTYRIYFD